MAESFLKQAELAHEFDDGDDPYVTNALITAYVHAGIASADAVCCIELKEHSQGGHNEAVQLIRGVRPDGADLAKALATLLGLKTEAGYGSKPLSVAKATRAERCAAKLHQAARDRL